MVNWKKIAVLLTLLLIISALGAGFYYTKNYYFQKGGQAGYEYAVYQAAKDLNEKGYTGLTIGEQQVILVPYIQNNTEEAKE